MHNVGLHGRSLFKPALRHSVLAVIDVALTFIVAYMVAKVIIGGTRIHIPHLAISTLIGLGVSGKQAIIA